jgi:hypothetical protein
MCVLSVKRTSRKSCYRYEYYCSAKNPRPVVGAMFSRFSLGGKDKKEEKESPSKGRASMQSVSSDTVDFNAMLDNSFLASTL